MVMRIFVLFTALMMGNLTIAHAEKINFKDIIIYNAWIKDTPPNQKITAGYLTIENLSDTDQKLIFVSSSFAAKGQIHQMKTDGEVMKMRPMTDGLFVPANGTIELRPGGFHLMFTQLNRQIILKQTHRITLTFQNIL